MLYLLPNLLADDCYWQRFFPQETEKIVRSLDFLIAESEKKAYQYLRLFSVPKDKYPSIFLCNEHTTEQQMQEIMQNIDKKKIVGLISDCGMPSLADPGAKLVFLAQKRKIPVEVIMGPSSIFVALLLSGLASQRFCFLGYLPRKQEALVSQIKKMEKDSYKNKSSQIWIETPYRTKKMMDILRKLLQPSTYLCIAQNLTSQRQKVITLPVREWRKKEVHNDPCVFVMQAFK